MTADELAAEVGKAAAFELGEAFARIRHCVGQLADEQVWFRSGEQLNSIGNLLLHLSGNVRQYLVAGLTHAPDTRDRPKEFLERSPIAKGDLLARLGDAVADAQRAMSAMTAAELLLVRRIQNRDFTGLAAIMQSVPHFRGHTQEITYMARSLLGSIYRFAGMPPEPAMASPTDKSGHNH